MHARVGLLEYELAVCSGQGALLEGDGVDALAHGVHAQQRAVFLREVLAEGGLDLHAHVLQVGELLIAEGLDGRELAGFEPVLLV